MSSSDPNRDVKKSNEKITETSKDDNPEKYDYGTIINTLFKKLDVVKERKDENRKKDSEEFQKNVSLNVEINKNVITLDNSMGIYVNISSLLIRKQNKASGPGIIFGTDGKSVLNFDENCLPVPYCEIFEDKSFKETKIVLYTLPNFVVPFQDDAAPVDGIVSRKTYILKVFIIILLQILYTETFVLTCISIEAFGNFIKGTILFFVMFAMDLILYLTIYFWEPSRKKKPYHYILLGMLTVFSAHPLGYIHAQFNSPVLLLMTLFGTMTLLLVLLGLKSFLNVGQLSPRSHVIINALLIFVFILFLIVLVGLWTLGNNFLMYVFLCIFLPIEIFLILYLYQLMLGRGGRHAMKTDEHILTAVMLYIHINTILILSLVLLKGPYTINII